MIEMRYFSVCFLVATTSISGELIEFNDETDTELVKDNEMVRQLQLQNIQFPSGRINDYITYSAGYLTGVDSLQRAGQCTKIVKDEYTSIYDFHIGFNSIVATLERVTINGTDMSAYFRPGNTSFHIQLTLNFEGECRITLNVLELERLDDVSVGSSRPEFDGAYFDDLFQTEVRAALNHKFSKLAGHAEQAIQVYVCGYEDGPSALLSSLLQL